MCKFNTLIENLADNLAANLESTRCNILPERVVAEISLDRTVKEENSKPVVKIVVNENHEKLN